jgi:predicted ester cyclase
MQLEESHHMPSSPEQNKDVIWRFLKAWNDKRPDLFDALVAPDVVRHCPATPAVIVQNLDQLKEFMRQDTLVFPDSVQTVVHIAAEGDLVGLWATYEGTQRGPIGPLPPTGVKAKFEFAGTFRMAEGRISEWWMTWDNMSILRALGHLPAS